MLSSQVGTDHAREGIDQFRVLVVADNLGRGGIQPAGALPTDSPLHVIVLRPSVSRYVPLCILDFSCNNFWSGFPRNNDRFRRLSAIPVILVQDNIFSVVYQPPNQLTWLQPSPTWHANCSKTADGGPKFSQRKEFGNPHEPLDQPGRNLIRKDIKLVYSIIGVLFSLASVDFIQFPPGQSNSILFHNMEVKSLQTIVQSSNQISRSILWSKASHVHE